MATTLTPAEVAADLGTDARTTRKFLRTVARDDDRFRAPGKGGRWAIEKSQMRTLRSKFSKWVEAQEAAKADRAAKADTTDKVDTELETDEVDIPLEELEGPTEDDLLEVDNED